MLVAFVTDARFIVVHAWAFTAAVSLPVDHVAYVYRSPAKAQWATGSAVENIWCIWNK